MSTLASVEARLATLEATVADKTAEADTFYLLWAAGLVFLMQVSCAQHTRNILVSLLL